MTNILQNLLLHFYVQMILKYPTLRHLPVFLHLLEEAREFFSKDYFATKATGIIITEVGDHYARCSLTITRDHQNAYGGVMGGAIFTLAAL